MPTKEYFEKYPPFPSDVPVVDLKCLSFTKLLANDASESEKLFQASQETGFFLIDLKGSEKGEAMLKHAKTAFDFNEQIHQIEKDEMAKYAFKPPTNLFGYKPAPYNADILFIFCSCTLQNNAVWQEEPSAYSSIYLATNLSAT